MVWCACNTGSLVTAWEFPLGDMKQMGKLILAHCKTGVFKYSNFSLVD